MSLMRIWFRRARMLVGSISPRRRVLIALLGLLGLAGVVLWAMQGNSQPLTPVLNEPFDAPELASAVAMLESRGIAAVARDNKLYTPADQAAKARAVLAYEGILPRNLSSAFEQLVRDSDPWSTSEQNDKKWQALKMATLSRMIAMFPPVRSATVLYEPGTTKRLGGPAVEPTASVKLALKPNAAMDHKLVRAIADLVAGSISGMNRRNVCIIDGAGQSYHVTEEGIAAEDKLEQLRQAEAFYREKIRAALAYMDNVIIGVHVEGDAATGKCLSASVCAPRSYFAAIHRSTATQPADTSDQALTPVIEAQLPRIQQAVMKVIGADTPQSVAVDWYYDAPVEPASLSLAAPPAEPNNAGSPAALVIASCLVVLGAGATAVLILKVRKRHRALAELEDSAEDEATGAETGFAFLQEASTEKLCALLASEHPQASALVLANLSPGKSAAVLARLEPSLQMEVVRRIASMEHIDPQVAQDVARGIAQRLGGMEGARASGVEIIARILHQGNPLLEQSVLSGLRGSEPTLAESIRRQMVSFEDLSRLPSTRLRAALEQFDPAELAVALRTASEPLSRKVLSSLSSAAASQVREEMERMGPVRLSDVESAQQHVAEVVRRHGDGQYVPAQASESELLA